MKKKSKTILTTAVATFVALVLLFGGSFFMLAMFMPRAVADFTYNLGLKEISLHYYEKAYLHSTQTDDLYNALSVAIMVNNHDKVVTFYEELEASEDYYELMNELDEETNNASLSIIAKSALLNEDNYLKNRYVFALLQTNQTPKAMDYSVEHFTRENLTMTTLGSYTFSQFNNNPSLLSDALQEETYGNLTLLQANENYVVELFTMFETNYNLVGTFTALQKSQLMYLGNRTISVANCLVQWSAVTTLNISLDDVLMYAQTVAQKLATL